MCLSWVAERQLMGIVKLIIYRGWADNGNTGQCRNKTLCWLPWKNISCVFRYSFVCLCCVVPVSVQYRLCLVTVGMNTAKWKTSQIFKEGRLFGCAFSWSICNQDAHFIRCMQSSSFQGYDDKHKSWEDISARRNSGRKPKLSERDRCTLKRIVSIVYKS